MPLTHAEREFLDAFVNEATNGPPFGGPATKDLNRRGIWYPDLSWILTAYQRKIRRREEFPPDSGTLARRPSPWQGLEEVKLRNKVLMEELETADMEIAK